MILLYLGLLAGLYYVYFHVKHRRRIELAEKFPGPKTVPFFGNALMYFNKSPEDVLVFMGQFRKEFGDLFRVWIGPVHLGFFSTNPKDLEIVLSSMKHIRKNNLYDFLVPWLGTGLLISTGQKWHARRKIITPTFHFKILEQFLEIFNKKGQIMIDLMKKTIKPGEVVNIYSFINLCTLDIISETAMGIELNSMNNSDSDYVKAVARMSQIATTRFVKVWMRNDFVFNYFCWKLKREQDQCIKIMHDFTDKIIKQRRGKLSTASIDNDEDSEEVEGAKKKMALLDVLLKSSVHGQTLTDADIREEVDTFMFEGHDTTTSGICFTLLCISKHPEVQRKLYEEIESVIGLDNSLAPKYSDLGELKYMELVIKEALRMYPPVPIFGRKLEEEVNLNGRIIPANSNFVVGVFLLGMDESIYPEPKKFIPERFLPENGLEKNPYAYVPFSAGPRNCIGQKFAILEIKSLLTKILSTFELFDSGIEPIVVTELVLRSQNGFNVGMRLRSQ